MALKAQLSWFACVNGSPDLPLCVLLFGCFVKGPFNTQRGVKNLIGQFGVLHPLHPQCGCSSEKMCEQRTWTVCCFLLGPKPITLESIQTRPCFHVQDRKAFQTCFIATPCGFQNLPLVFWIQNTKVLVQTPPHPAESCPSAGPGAARLHGQQLFGRHGGLAPGGDGPGGGRVERRGTDAAVRADQRSTGGGGGRGVRGRGGGGAE